MFARFIVYIENSHDIERAVLSGPYLEIARLLVNNPEEDHPIFLIGYVSFDNC